MVRPYFPLHPKPRPTRHTSHPPPPGNYPKADWLQAGTSADRLLPGWALPIYPACSHMLSPCSTGQWMGYQMSPGGPVLQPIGPQTHNQLIPLRDDKSLYSCPIAWFASEVKANLACFLESMDSIPISKMLLPLYGHPGPHLKFEPHLQYARPLCLIFFSALFTNILHIYVLILLTVYLLVEYKPGRDLLFVPAPRALPAQRRHSTVVERGGSDACPCWQAAGCLAVGSGPPVQPAHLGPGARPLGLLPRGPALTFSLCSCSLLTRASSWAFRRLRASMRASHWATRQASNSTLFSCVTEHSSQRPGARGLPARTELPCAVHKALLAFLKQLHKCHPTVVVLCFTFRLERLNIT